MPDSSDHQTKYIKVKSLIIHGIENDSSQSVIIIYRRIKLPKWANEISIAIQCHVTIHVQVRDFIKNSDWYQ